VRAVSCRNRRLGSRSLAYVATYLFAAGTISAQSTTTEARIDELLRGSYQPASSPEQMLDCHYRALTRQLRLNASQEESVKAALRVFRRAPNPAPRDAVWQLRFAIRDSSVLAVLTRPADSVTYRKNAGSERAWFAAGNCNGRTVPRR
jgi:hypothetical protein